LKGRYQPLRLIVYANNTMNDSEPSIKISRVYWMKPGQRIVDILLCVVGLFFLVAFWWPVLFGAKQPNFLELMFPVAYLLFSGIFTIKAFRSFVRLSESSIELRSLSGSKLLPFDKIKGQRRYIDHGDQNTPTVRHLVLEPNDDRFPKLDIEETYRFDNSFYDWFNALPDLDELNKRSPKSSNFGLV
jgi:hypothetical protein